ncbi:hypothetical protein ONZ45_g2059 [Pleurotus djamor]|nr:hypothetical protein ONZ45_g2059 [Pleurotus djamor]
MPSYRRLQQIAVAISILSILYNGAEGGLSIGFGAESSSRSLVFFGIQSGIEVISSILVVWRFRHIAKPGEERGLILSPRDLQFEKVASTGIAILLILLGLATEAISMLGLVRHDEPDASNASLIISASALVIMILIWLPKNYLARTLDSSAMQGEAQCSLSCIQITIVLFAGSLIFRLWKGGWWVDSATSIILGLMFAWEGFKLLRWVRNPSFDGGCCKHDSPGRSCPQNTELVEAYHDICTCCEQKEKCKEADTCKCESQEIAEANCCKPAAGSPGDECCTRKMVQGKRQEVAAVEETACASDSCCKPPEVASPTEVKDSKAPKASCDCSNNLGKANDFDLFVYNGSTNQEYKDDSEMIPRSSSIIVKRMPAVKPGRGKASMYLAGSIHQAPTSDVIQRPGASSHNSWHRGAMSKRFDGKEDAPAQSQPKPAAPALMKNNIAGEDEAAAMAAMFQAQSANWEETQEKMSQLVLPRWHFLPPKSILILAGLVSLRVGVNRSLPNNLTDHCLLPMYAIDVARKVGQPLLTCFYEVLTQGEGHWIQDCPTNNDREYDNRPRIKRTTGIPRSMLKAVENPNSGQNVMVTPEGGYVVAQPDAAAWQKQVSRPKGITVAEVREKAPTDSSLACPIDNKLFRDAMKTPCCEKAYCEECIQTHLLEKDFMCPNCNKKIASLDKLVADKAMQAKVTEYIDRAIEESRKVDVDGEGKPSSDPNAETNLDQDLYSDQQPGGEMDMSEAISANIPQLQAQIAQLSVMLQNPSLPNQVRQATEMQYQQLQMELAQAQTFQTALAVATSMQQEQQQLQAAQNMMQQQGGYQNWNNQFQNQQPVAQDSAYQRLPVNNRRRGIKRDRPSDFLEIGGDESKMPRYWE